MSRYHLRSGGLERIHNFSATIATLVKRPSHISSNKASQSIWKWPCAAGCEYLSLIGAWIIIAHVIWRNFFGKWNKYEFKKHVQWLSRWLRHEHRVLPCKMPASTVRLLNERNRGQDLTRPARLCVTHIILFTNLKCFQGTQIMLWETEVKSTHGNWCDFKASDLYVFTH